MTVDFTNDYPFKPPVVNVDIASKNPVLKESQLTLSLLE
jgi:ubiquitin-protein ligase